MKGKIKLLIVIISMLFGNIAFANLTDGLVAYYPFNGNANDESGNGNNGTVYNAVLTLDRAGSVNSAYYFDGNGDYIDTGARTNFNLLHNGSSFTVSLWEKHDASVKSSGLLGNVTGVDRPGIWYTVFDYGKSVSLGIGRYTPYPVAGKRWENVISDPSSWNHLVITYDQKSNEYNLFVNGQNVNDPASPINPHQDIDAQQNLKIGTQKTSPSYGWATASIDEVRIYNRALTISEIQQLAAGGTAPQPAPKLYGLFIGMDYSDDDGKIFRFTDGPDGKTIAKEYYDFFSKQSNWASSNPQPLILDPIEDYPGANKAQIESMLRTISDVVAPDDYFVFYYVGHGAFIENPEAGDPCLTYGFHCDGESSPNTGDEFLTITDGITTGVKFNSPVDMLRDDVLTEYLAWDNFKEVNKLVILSSCYSGGFMGDSQTDAGDLDKLSKIALIAAAEEGKNSYGGALVGRPYFDRILLNILNQKGLISSNKIQQQLINADISSFLGEESVSYGMRVPDEQVKIFVESDWSPTVKATKDFVMQIVPFPWTMFLPAITGAK